jgi:hypothetical protein
VLCMEKKMGHLLETHCLPPYTWSSNKHTGTIIRMSGLSVWIFLEVHNVCHTFHFAIVVWLLFLDFAICSCVLQKKLICCNGYFILHKLLIILVCCIAHNIKVTTIQYVISFKFSAKIPPVCLNMSKDIYTFM